MAHAYADVAAGRQGGLQVSQRLQDVLEAVKLRLRSCSPGKDRELCAAVR